MKQHIMTQEEVAKKKEALTTLATFMQMGVDFQERESKKVEKGSRVLIARFQASVGRRDFITTIGFGSDGNSPEGSMTPIERVLSLKRHIDLYWARTLVPVGPFLEMANHADSHPFRAEFEYVQGLVALIDNIGWTDQPGPEKMSRILIIESVGLAIGIRMVLRRDDPMELKLNLILQGVAKVRMKINTIILERRFKPYYDI